MPNKDRRCSRLKALALREVSPNIDLFHSIGRQLAGIDGPGATNEAVRLGAARELLDRGYGRPVQAIAGDSAAGSLLIDFRWADEAPAPNMSPLIETQAADTEVDADPVAIWSSSC
jgi:hypothetical protein